MYALLRSLFPVRHAPTSPGFLTIPVLALTLAVAACDGPTAPGEPAPIESLPRELTASEEAVIRGSNVFGLELLAHTVEQDDRPNIVLSPLSASMALGMTLNGAAGGTFTAMRAALGFEGLEPGEINASYRGLIDLLADLDPAVTFEIANAIWANDQTTFHQSFFDAVTAAFDAEVTSADFQAPQTVDDVNAWVTESTSGKITKIVDSLPSNYVMLLLNAIYFDGNWTTRFDPEDTRPAPFTRADGSEVQVDMMHLDAGEIGLGGGDGFLAAELPYGGGAYAMVILVPHDGDVRSLAASMDAARWDSAMRSLTVREPDLVALPKLNLTYDVVLNDVLSAMGMDVAFGRGADFSNMSPEGEAFCIDSVRQKTFLEVDEAGTRAAAVTSVGVGTTSFNGLLVDRPFLLAIRERLSGTILFSGIIEDPTAAPEAGDPVASRCF